VFGTRTCVARHLEDKFWSFSLTLLHKLSHVNFKQLKTAEDCQYKKKKKIPTSKAIELFHSNA
jgi:hypothetical protein